ncbi:MAG: methylmalonyl Co-A mutase-associated GTPase MeaB [Hyphomicrobiales bacterium]|nr:methylmalonyl Co-A mutase-associated GTPase MeaB [Hyphomicrobiales bacterium]
MTTVAPPVDLDAAALVARLRSGELTALSRAVTELERLSRSAPALLAAMEPHLGGALVVGVTGPPGAGKSTLVNATIRELRRRGRTVGVVAVDPSSPVSGGAILGDRIRMGEHTEDDGVFVRSLASRGHLGGLSPAAVRVIDALDAAGKDVVILETVGTGQSEIDIAAIADLRLVVMAPGLGDDIQAMKSGVIEIADVLVVNKGDLPGADRTARQLKAALALRSAAAREVPVLRTVATTGGGIDALADAVTAASERLTPETAAKRRRRRAHHLIGLAAAALVRSRMQARSDTEMRALCNAVLSGSLSPADAAKAALGSE